MEFVFDREKNEKLKRERGISFEMAIEKISRDDILIDYAHPDRNKYPRQRIAVIMLHQYPHCVPYIDLGTTWVLKTIYPSRIFKRILENK